MILHQSWSPQGPACQRVPAGNRPPLFQQAAGCGSVPRAHRNKDTALCEEVSVISSEGLSKEIHKVLHRETEGERWTERERERDDRER